jgi:transcriptional regulator with XRE-family HTH domain
MYISRNILTIGPARYGFFGFVAQWGHIHTEERMEQFGEKLRRLRGETTQKTVAEALDMPQTTLSSLEKQRSVPRGEVLTKLADFFKVPVEYFYDEPERKRSEGALAWLEQLKADTKGRETIATHSSARLDPKVSEHIAKRMLVKYEETQKKPS